MPIKHTNKNISGEPDQNLITNVTPVSSSQNVKIKLDKVNQYDETTSSVTNDFLKNITLSYNNTSGVLSFSANSTTLASVDIGLEKYVSSASIVTNPSGQPAGKYIKLSFEGGAGDIFINVNSITGDNIETTDNKKTTLSNSSTDYPSTSAVTSALDGKVDKVTGKGLSTNDYTTTEKNKLAGIASGAEVNVQSDWEQTNTSADDYIKNKPDLSSVGGGEVNVQSDWEQTDSNSDDYIKNKPTISLTRGNFDFDTLTTTGAYFATTASPNAPTTWSHFVNVSADAAANYVLQVAYNYMAPSDVRYMYFRMYAGSAWTSWHRVEATTL